MFATDAGAPPLFYAAFARKIGFLSKLECPTILTLRRLRSISGCSYSRSAYFFVGSAFLISESPLNDLTVVISETDFRFTFRRSLKNCFQHA